MREVSYRIGEISSSIKREEVTDKLTGTTNRIY